MVAAIPLMQIRVAAVAAGLEKCLKAVGLAAAASSAYGYTKKLNNKPKGEQQCTTS